MIMKWANDKWACPFSSACLGWHGINATSLPPSLSDPEFSIAALANVHPMPPLSHWFTLMLCYIFPFQTCVLDLIRTCLQRLYVSCISLCATSRDSDFCLSYFESPPGARTSRAFVLGSCLPEFQENKPCFSIAFCLLPTCLSSLHQQHIASSRYHHQLSS